MPEPSNVAYGTYLLLTQQKRSMFIGSKENPMSGAARKLAMSTAEDQRALRVLVSRRGDAALADDLSVSQAALTRAMAGLPVLRSTLIAIRSGISEISESEASALAAELAAEDTEDAADDDESDDDESDDDESDDDDDDDDDESDDDDNEA